MENTQNARIAVNITREDKVMLDKLKLALQARIGVALPTTQVVRLGLQALAKQEKVR